MSASWLWAPSGRQREGTCRHKSGSSHPSLPPSGGYAYSTCKTRLGKKINTVHQYHYCTTGNYPTRKRHQYLYLRLSRLLCIFSAPLVGYIIISLLSLSSVVLGIGIHYILQNIYRWDMKSGQLSCQCFTIPLVLGVC